MTAIVTGATGFIGHHLVDALAATGDEEVRCLTRGRPRADARPNVSSHTVDYSRADLGLGDEVFSGATAVYHLAGATRAISASAFTDANVQVTARLLDRLAGVGGGEGGGGGGSPRFVYVSSQAAAGPARDADQPKTETDPEAPIEDYGRSKLAAERLVRARAEDGRLAATIVRPVAVYGPGDRDFLSIFAMVRRGVAVYPGTRGSFINAVYVGDLVTGIVESARSPVAAGRTYFLGDDAPYSWVEIYATIGAVTGHAHPVEVRIPRGVVSMAGSIGDVVGAVTGKPILVSRNKAKLASPKYWLCSAARAREDFGFRTPTLLREGMEATYDWYLRHRWL